MSVANHRPQCGQTKTPSGGLTGASMSSIHRGRVEPGILAILYFAFPTLDNWNENLISRFSKIIPIPRSKFCGGIFCSGVLPSSSTMTIPCIFTKAGTSQRSWIASAICASCFSLRSSVSTVINVKVRARELFLLEDWYFTVSLSSVVPEVTARFTSFSSRVS